MTEEEWLRCDDPLKMVGFLHTLPRESLRVWRLFLAAFWNWQIPNIDVPHVRELLRERSALLHEWAETGRKPTDVTDHEQENVIFFHRSPYQGARQTARMPRGQGTKGKPAREAQTHFLRDIFGNPFRSVTVDPSWLTSDVVALARGIYDERAFDRLPILADALQDAGCDSADILDHCRGSGPHVRGCWVVDLLLGRA